MAAQPTHSGGRSSTGGLGQSPVEFCAADAEQLRRLSHVAFCLSQSLLDKGDLGLRQVEGQTHHRDAVHHWGNGRHSLQVKVPRLDIGAATFNQRTFYDVLEFADIARKVVGLQRLQRRVRDVCHPDAHFVGQQLQKMLRQQRDIILALAQSRHANREPARR